MLIHDHHLHCPNLGCHAARMGLTQQDLALAAGVGVRFIVDLEGGKPTVRLEQVLRVVDALGGSLALTGLDAQATQAEEGRHGA